MSFLPCLVIPSRGKSWETENFQISRLLCIFRYLSLEHIQNVAKNEIHEIFDKSMINILHNILFSPGLTRVEFNHFNIISYSNIDV